MQQHGLAVRGLAIVYGVNTVSRNHRMGDVEMRQDLRYEVATAERIRVVRQDGRTSTDHSELLLSPRSKPEAQACARPLLRAYTLIHQAYLPHEAA